MEAYSAAGETWFGWWLVEHYLSYHVNCPNSCDSGEPARGRKDPPYFQMGYGSFDHIPDLVDPFVNRYCQPNRGFPGLLLKGVRILTQHNLYPQYSARAAYSRINQCFL